MDPMIISGQFTVRRLEEEDIPAILALCAGNPLYYRYCPPLASEESIRSDMRALPPGKSLHDKYYIGYSEQEQLTAVMDLILAYPHEDTAFIGFFMVASSSQNKGAGSGIITGLCEALRRMGMNRIRPAWMKGNEQSEHFWLKNGFETIGETHDPKRARCDHR